jgi:hypothetical protein
MDLARCLLSHPPALGHFERTRATKTSLVRLVSVVNDAAVCRGGLFSEQTLDYHFEPRIALMLARSVAARWIGHHSFVDQTNQVNEHRPGVWDRLNWPRRHRFQS